MDWNVVVESFTLIWKGASKTLSLFAWSLVIGTLLGLAVALMKLSPAKPLSWFSSGFSWLFRGIPLLILLFYAFFALPEAGWLLSPFGRPCSVYLYGRRHIRQRSYAQASLRSITGRPRRRMLLA